MGIGNAADASLQKWGRLLRTVSPAMDEVAVGYGNHIEAVEALEASVVSLANVGAHDLPANSAIVSEVEAVAAELKAIKADAEANLTRFRKASARAGALGAMYDRAHFMDEDRLNGTRGTREQEKRADVGRAEQDT